jgi:uncharacterized protein YecE (DUF72 family)
VTTPGQAPSKAGLPYVGTAGWSIPQGARARFPDEGSLLERYASRFGAVEINSSFYRSHREKTYQRWSASAPSGFLFAVKAPRQITHERRLEGAGDALTDFARQIGCLGKNLGPVLFQLPPSLAFDAAIAGRFLNAWRRRFEGLTVCEPRHVSWASPVAARCLSDWRVARVIADPEIVPQSPAAPSGDDCVYYRLHGSPVMYESQYGDAYLDRLLPLLTASAAERSTWCIFDNTKYGAATVNALTFTQKLRAVTGLAG